MIGKKLFVLILLSLSMYHQSHGCYSDQERKFVQNLSLGEKIGQLFMVGAIATPHEPQKSGEYTEDQIKAFVEKYHIGGIIYLEHSTPEEQLSTTQRLQSFNKRYNKLDLWLGLDAEWGPAMRLDNTVKFPFNLALGAIQEESLIEKLGYIIGEQMRALGTSINFAPVADTNTNPGNPIINCRSFGQHPESVTLWALAYARGLAQAGIMACAKHFPGHGNTNIDSHVELPVIDHNIAIELAPFKQLIRNSIPSIMVGHLLLPAYDKNAPATLSRAMITRLLKKECGFNGLVITDGLNMQGITNIFKPGEIEVKALQAGADLLLIPANVDAAFSCVKQAVLDGHISQKELDEHVFKIIHAKNMYKQSGNCTPENITATLNSQEAQDLSRLLYQKAITVVKNNGSIPLNADTSTTVITIGLTAENPFVTTLRKARKITSYTLPQSPSAAELAGAYAALYKAQTIIIGLAGLSYVPYTNYNIAPQTVEFIEALGKHCIVVLFGNPYALALFKDMPALIEAYEDYPYAQIAAAEVLLGTIPAEGQLPIKV